MQPKYGFVDRIHFAGAGWIAYWIARMICSTIRWEFEKWRYPSDCLPSDTRSIHAFWHGRIFASMYHFRNRGIVVMTSRNRDGEYIARVIKRLGYGVARGSSSRGSRSALAEMQRMLEQNRDVAFTMDGPRGPRYVAKPGAVWLAASSGCPIVPFNVSLERKWVMGSWDGFEIPKPFSRAVLLFGDPVYVPAGASKEEQAAAQEELQQTLDCLRERGDSRWR